MMRATDISATGTALDSGGTTVQALQGARLVAAAATATAVIRETNGSGAVILRLSAAANGADECFPPGGIAFPGIVHVTLTGASAALTLYS